MLNGKKFEVMSEIKSKLITSCDIFPLKTSNYTTLEQLHNFNVKPFTLIITNQKNSIKSKSLQHFNRDKFIFHWTKHKKIPNQPQFCAQNHFLHSVCVAIQQNYYCQINLMIYEFYLWGVRSIKHDLRWEK